jgi:putative acetyltransferase
MSNSTPQSQHQQQQDIVIRRAIKSDASAIIKVHYDAVHITASKDYDEAILDDWSSLPDDRVERLEAQIEDNPESTIMIVAEIAGAIVGFGEIAPSNNELRAVYVSPSAGRKAVGKAILQALETLARDQRVPELWLDSSLTAEPFYLAHGYLRDGQADHQLRSGRKMICIKMHKRLDK